MYLTKENAQSIVEEMKNTIHHDINIMDHSGIIIASTNPSRCRKIHSGALKIISDDSPVKSSIFKLSSRGFGRIITKYADIVV